MWEGYRERGDYRKVDLWLEKNGVPLNVVHTSGHAGISDLQKLASCLNPRKVIPIHSFTPERYGEFFSSVECHDDGEWWDV
jgi:ribonuclease J